MKYLLVRDFGVYNIQLHCKMCFQKCKHREKQRHLLLKDPIEIAFRVFSCNSDDSY